AAERIALLAKKKREPRPVGQTFRQTNFHAWAMRRAAFAPAQRRRQRAAGIENEQVARAKVSVDVIEARVFDLAGRAINYQQSHLVTPDPTTFRRLLCAQLRR